MPPKPTVPALCALLLLGACGGSPGTAPQEPASRALAGEARVTLLQTTDLHHHARGLPGASSGSYARIAAYVEQVRATAGHPVLLVDSGDWTMGTLYDLTLGQRPLALLFMNALGYDCTTLGNHEFDHGEGGLAGTLAIARRTFGFSVPIVASNLRPGVLEPLVGPGGMIQATRVKVLANGLRVGFLGLMGRDAAGDVFGPARFRDYGRDCRLVQDLVDDLRGRQGCHLVIALAHAGTSPAGDAGEDIDLARQVTGVDVIASGHTHNPLAAARAVANGAWTTRVCCAGAFGSHVSRLDLVYRGAGGAVLEASENRAMTDASLAGLEPPAAPDPAFAFLVAAADRDLNRALVPVLQALAPAAGFDPDDPARGIHRVLGSSEPELGTGAGGPLPPAPGGLGDFCADALRAVANALRSGSADATPFAAGLVASGVLRGSLGQAGTIRFADLFGILPLGQSPDPEQARVPGEPVLSAYLDPDGVRELCALQLLAQTGLTGSDDYLNLSGLSYGLDPEGVKALFDGARVAAVLARTRERAAGGSAAAALALAAAAALPADSGDTLRVLAAQGNPYAAALAGMGGPGPVVAAAEADAGDGGSRLARLLFGLARAAIGPVAGFAPGDPACTGPTGPLPPGRLRLALDLDAVLGFERIRARFGVAGSLYQAAQGDARLSGASADGLAAILASRISLDPAGPCRELKAWMAPLLYLTTPPERGGHFVAGRITGEYAAAGPAVRIRNASYPLDRIAALAATLAGLDGAP